MSSTQSSKERLNWIDQTKGLAILGIVLFHFFQNYPDRISLVSLLDRSGAKIGYAAVDIFFVMAGFNTSYVLAAIAQKNKMAQISANWKSWLSKRLSRLYPTYILAVIVSLVLYTLVGRTVFKSGLDAVLIFLGIAGYQKFRIINPGFWFFFVILQAYLITPLIFIICKNKAIRILLLGTVIGVLNKILGMALINQDFQTGLFFAQNNVISSYIFQLCLGLYWGFVYLNHKSFRRVDFTVSIGIFIGGIIIYSTLGLMGIDIIYKLGFDMLFTPIFFLLCYWLFEKMSESGWMAIGLSFMSLLGIYSYQIYLIHQPLYFVLLPYLTSQIAINSDLKILLVMIITACLLLVYVFSFTYLEKFFRNIMGQLSSKQS